MADQSFIDKQKKSLLEEKGCLEEKIAKLRQYPDYGIDEEDNIREITDYESNRSFENEMEFLLKKVDAALAAIENGTYGLCSSCQKAIEENRLGVMPYADLCTICKNGKSKKK